MLLKPAGQAWTGAAISPDKTTEAQRISNVLNRAITLGEQHVSWRAERDQKP